MTAAPDETPSAGTATPDLGSVEEYRRALMTDSAATATALREETAQALALVLVRLATLQELPPTAELQAELDELRQVVRVELGRVLQLAHLLSTPSVG